LKILKSGVELTPKELSAIRGGTCACGCEGGYSSGTLNASGDEKGECYCGCTSGEGAFNGSLGSAFTYCEPQW
jgi:hypothetical protein